MPATRPGSGGRCTSRCKSLPGLLGNLELLLVKKRILAQNDVQAVGFFELAHQLTKGTLKVLRHHRVNDQRYLLAEITHFFEIYKALEPHKHTAVDAWQGRERAIREITESRRRHHDHGA